MNKLLRIVTGDEIFGWFVLDDSQTLAYEHSVLSDEFGKPGNIQHWYEHIIPAVEFTRPTV